jgi:hypothetical protein
MYANENELYAGVLCGHLREMVWRLRRIPDDRWDWTFAPPAPTPRILATHAFQWLACDRQHILEPDISRHRKVPEPPREPAVICDLLEAETENGTGSSARSRPSAWPRCAGSSCSAR